MSPRTTVKASALLVMVMTTLAAPASAEVGPCDSEQALQVMKQTLPQASEDRPIHVTFRTRAEGVKVPAWLLAQYPEEMPIILQYEFEHLVVKNDRFEVGLWFKGRPERLVIPFATVKAFFDQSVAKCSSG